MNATFSTCASLTRGGGAAAAAKSMAADRTSARPCLTSRRVLMKTPEDVRAPVLMRAVVPRRCTMLRRALPHLFTAVRAPVRCAPMGSLASPGGGLASRLGSLPAGTRCSCGCCVRPCRTLHRLSIALGGARNPVARSLDNGDDQHHYDAATHGGAETAVHASIATGRRNGSRGSDGVAGG
jgi:hypothetical protein